MPKQRRTERRTSGSSPEPELKSLALTSDPNARTGRVRALRQASNRQTSTPPPLSKQEAATQTSYYASNSERQTWSGSDLDSDSSDDSSADALPPVSSGSRRPSTLIRDNSGETDSPSAAPTSAGPRTSDFLVVKPLAHHGFAASTLDSIHRSHEAFSHYLPNAPPMLSRAMSPGPNSTNGTRRRGSPSPMHPDIQHITANNARAPKSALKPLLAGARFRSDVLIEVALLTIVLAMACYRMNSLPKSGRFNPAAPLLVLTCLTPFITLFRRSAPSTHLMVPFTDERGYRSRAQADDGFGCGVALPVVTSAAMVWDCFVAKEHGRLLQLGGLRLLPEIWDHVTSNLTLTPQLEQTPSVLLESRKSLLVSMTLNSFVLILQLLLSRTVLQVNWIPTSNTRRFFGAVGLSTFVSGLAGFVVLMCRISGYTTSHFTASELMFSMFLYQMSLYLISRLARRAFTLGELAMVTSAGDALLLEFGRLAYARWQYKRNAMLPETFRAPTPLIAFQHVLIPGVFLIGFLLSPLLVVSRHLASKPSYRLRWPAQKERNRRLLATGVLVGLIGIVFGMFGGWMGYMLKGNIWRPWFWAFRYNVFGGDGIDGMRGEWHGWQRWRRLSISAYWLGAVVLAIAGWQTRLVRARKKLSTTGSTSEKMHAEANKEEKRIHVSLDLRRKFFHAMAMLIFVPGIALDPSFTSLAFSVAFSVFTLAEFSRYFALWPIGAPIHVFFHEFVDAKDAGPVVLSHFYLLTGCAGPLWLEGSGIKRFAGVLALGVGDALASTIGRRIGGTRWPGTSKTLIGSLSFVGSIMAVSWLLVILGWAEPFNTHRYLLATTLTAVLEATTTQNDNLMIPIFFWSVQTLFTPV